MTKDEGMTKSEARMLSGALTLIRHSRTFWGAHAPSRTSFGVLAEMLFPPVSPAREKVGEPEGVIASTRGASAPL
jgi:hypothetical protein